jgi:hypothetical protein
MYRPQTRPGQLVVEAATDEDFLSDFLSLPPDDFDESDEPEDPDEPDEPESPDELVDFEESELPDELSADDPFDPLAEPSLAEPSLAAGTVLAPARLSVR